METVGVILVKPHSDTLLQLTSNSETNAFLKGTKNKSFAYSRQEHPHGRWTSSTTTSTLSPWTILRNLPQVDEVCNSQHNFLLRKSFTFAVSFSSRLQ